MSPAHLWAFTASQSTGRTGWSALPFHQPLQPDTVLASAGPQPEEQGACGPHGPIKAGFYSINLLDLCFGHSSTSQHWLTAEEQKRSEIPPSARQTTLLFWSALSSLTIWFFFTIQIYTYHRFWQGTVLNPSLGWWPSLVLGCIARNSINTVKYAKIVSFCFSEKKGKGDYFLQQVVYKKLLLKTFLLKVRCMVQQAQHHLRACVK